MGNVSLAPNRVAPTIGYSGKLPEDTLQVLMDAWDQPIYVASNYARQHLTTVALCASLGWLSTVTPDGRDFDRRWHLTSAGFNTLSAFNKDP